MAESLSLRLLERNMITESLTLHIGYDRQNCDTGTYLGPVHIDHYGRQVPKSAHGTIRLDTPSNLDIFLIKAAVGLYEQIADHKLLIRRINITANKISQDTGTVQLDLFTDLQKLEKERKLQETMLNIKKRFGKNSVLKGTSFLEGSTMRDRNRQIGGHKA